jgi:hypothetical protein
LAAERGDDPDEFAQASKRWGATNDHMTRPVLIVAERR